jgi:hypothetical protein
MYSPKKVVDDNLKLPTLNVHKTFSEVPNTRTHTVSECIESLKDNRYTIDYDTGRNAVVNDVALGESDIRFLNVDEKACEMLDTVLGIYMVASHELIPEITLAVIPKIYHNLLRITRMVVLAQELEEQVGTIDHMYMLHLAMSYCDGIGLVLNDFDSRGSAFHYNSIYSYITGTELDICPRKDFVRCFGNLHKSKTFGEDARIMKTVMQVYDTPSTFMMDTVGVYTGTHISDDGGLSEKAILAHMSHSRQRLKDHNPDPLYQKVYGMDKFEHWNTFREPFKPKDAHNSFIDLDEFSTMVNKYNGWYSSSVCV